VRGPRSRQAVCAHMLWLPRAVAARGGVRNFIPVGRHGHLPCATQFIVSAYAATACQRWNGCSWGPADCSAARAPAQLHVHAPSPGRPNFTVSDIDLKYDLHRCITHMIVATRIQSFEVARSASAVHPSQLDAMRRAVKCDRGYHDGRRQQ